MADDDYNNFQSEMDPRLMGHMSNFISTRQEENAESYGDAKPSISGPGFYLDQYAVANMHGVAVPNLLVSHQSSSTSTSNAASTSGLYESPTNYAMKPEKGLPLTPPGSPSEIEKRTLQEQQHCAMSMYMLAKPRPVPMIQHQMKRHPHTRPVETIVAPIESMLTESMLGQATAAAIASGTSPTLARALSAVQQTQKRPRGEKKPIPDEQKDNRYFERRKRNNNAAKKSRDARKSREDEIAIRASFLEKENAILRAQVSTLREEANSLKEMLLQKRGAT